MGKKLHLPDSEGNVAYVRALSGLLSGCALSGAMSVFAQHGSMTLCVASLLQLRMTLVTRSIPCDICKNMP